MRIQRWITRIILGLTVFLLASPPTDGGERGSKRRTGRLDEELVKVGIQLYNLNMQVPKLYAKEFAKEHGEAGEGLYSDLFNDAITVLQLAIRQNERNVLARFYLGKAYYAKSYEGEGTWTKSLVDKAEEQFSLVVLQAEEQPVPRDVLAKSQEMLEDVRKIQKGD